MSRTSNSIKKIEKQFASNVTHGFGHFFRILGNIFVRIFKVFDSKLTIMIVPHSQGKVINFQTNVFALILGFLLAAGVIASFFFYNSHSLSANREISNLEEQNRTTLASLDELRDENANLFQAAKRFQSSLSQSLSLLGIDQVKNPSNTASSNSDLAALFTSTELSQGTSKEVADIKELTTYLEDAVKPIEQIGKMLKTQQNLFTEIPSICPVKNPNYHISMAFGPNIHPLNGNWYIHKGLDFSTWRSGDPVMATASGQVVTVSFDNSFGNYVIIKHNHGMYTRYAHLNAFRVKKGQIVEQGEIIGTIGNTGVSTGPHLHYEVHIGSDVVDPAKYININLSK
ncbi:MAG: M23 family metallopeptidase [Treponema sp.]|nr:M23 family metallopeptidase [Treponema sp.]